MKRDECKQSEPWIQIKIVMTVIISLTFLCILRNAHVYLWHIYAEGITFQNGATNNQYEQKASYSSELFWLGLRVLFLNNKKKEQ